MTSRIQAPDTNSPPWRGWAGHALLLSSLTLLGLAVACEGSTGPPGPAGPPADPGDTPTELPQGDPGPGLHVDIVSVSGGSLTGGNVAPGDTLTVRYTIKKDDGSDWDASELSSNAIMVSGPSFNYQRVLPSTGDLLANSVQQSDGSYDYTFATPIPAVYAAPYNDTPDFGPDDGELTGQALLDGTYTVGLYLGWNWTSGSDSGRLTDDATFDFALGASGTTVGREVVGQDNCNQCHEDLQFHGGLRKATTLCLLCHTAGSEDKNEPSAAGGTPGVTVEFSIMIHRIHNGAHLASVMGVTTDATGARDYTATPEPYQLVGYQNQVHDYSDVEFPAWPNVSSPMPRDTGYTALGVTEKAVEDQMRRGVTSCELCHGDPDGSGPIEAPADGDLAYDQPRRKTCVSCHDDWVTTNPYTANTFTMPPQPDDSSCNHCHPASGGFLAVRDAHQHPLTVQLFASGVVFDLTSVDEDGSNDGDGTIDPGEKIALTFTVQNLNGADVDASTLGSRSIVISGPTDNSNVLIDSSIPASLLSGAQPYTINAPERVYLESIGGATGGSDMFPTSLAPHWNLIGAKTDVYERGADGSSTTLVSAVTAPTNWIEVADASGFTRDDFVVLDDGGGNREILQVQWVDEDSSPERLWFSSPHTGAYPSGPLADHDSGESVTEIALALLTEDTEYSLDEASGVVMETGGFTNGAEIVCSYTTDYVVPATYGIAINDDPTLGKPFGQWGGMSLVSGTYTASVWGYIDRLLPLFGEFNVYRDTSPSGSLDFLVGDATTPEPYALIAGSEGCYRCHVDITFHGGGRRGWDSCLACHGTSGAADRPRYVAANAPETSEVSIGFRQMLHKIHMGADLANASTYTVVGFGQGWPDNYSTHTYEEVHFPAMPAGVKDCAVCHGDDNTAWQQPSERMHPTEQVVPIRSWLDACGSCHDSSAERAHIDANTSPSGAESCAVCHGLDKDNNVPDSHLVR